MSRIQPRIMGSDNGAEGLNPIGPKPPPSAGATAQEKEQTSNGNFRARGGRFFQRKDKTMSAIDKARLFLACLAIAEQESREAQPEDGPVQVGIVGGEVMEFGPQGGGEIPF